MISWNSQFFTAMIWISYDLSVFITMSTLYNLEIIHKHDNDDKNS